MVPLQEYLILGAILFTIGVVGVITRTNVIVIFMSVELMLNAGTLTFLAFSRVMNDMTGHVFAFMIMTVAAAEVAVGLAVVIALFRNRETVDVAEVNLLKG